MRAVVFLLLAANLIPLAGCAICACDDDYNYGAYGGIWQRIDMRHGRVGSAFSEVGVNVTGEGEALEPEPLPSGPPTVEELTEIETDSTSEADSGAVISASYSQNDSDDVPPVPLF